MIASPARVMLRELSSLAAPLPGFDPDTAMATPQDQFLVWLQDAVAAGIREPHAMTLSTVDAEGRPDARVLILKDLDERGWHFATSRLSPKGRQLTSKAEAALTFYWPWLGRQIRIRGTVIDLGWVAAAADFWARSPDAQANAALERQSQVMATEAAPGASAVAEMPSSWSVSAVRPESVEFWQGRTDRRHVRLRYERAGEGWTRVRLWP
jgi:pyridoxamine 5'-phosphate oxidase